MEQREGRVSSPTPFGGADDRLLEGSASPLFETQGVVVLRVPALAIKLSSQPRGPCCLQRALAFYGFGGRRLQSAAPRVHSGLPSRMVLPL